MIGDDDQIERAIERIFSTSGNIMDYMVAAGLDPLTDFRGGDWRECDFRGINLEGCNFQNARIYSAKFEGARVRGADFRNTEVWLTDFHKAKDWDLAKLKTEEKERVRRNLLAPGKRRTSTDFKDDGARDYNNRILNSETYQEARDIFHQMLTAGYAPDHFTYTALIGKAPDEEIALQLFSEAKSYKIKFDNVVFNSLADKMDSYEKARSIFDEMLSTTDLKEKEYDYNVLINKSKDFRIGRQLISEMRSLDITPTAISYNTILKWADGIDNVRAILDEMIEYGVLIRPIDIAVAIRKCTSDDDVSDIIRRSYNEDVRFDVNVYNALFKWSEGLSSALAIYREMKSVGIRPDRHSIYALLSKTVIFSDACYILGLARVEGVTFDSDMVRLLIRATPDPIRSRLIRAEIEGNQGSDDAVVEALVRFWTPYDERDTAMKEVFG